MLTHREAFPIRLGAGCPPESVTTLPPEGDWLSKPNAGRAPSVCGLNLDIALNRHHCLAEVGRPCGAAPVRFQGSKEELNASILSGNGAIFAPCWLVTPLGPCMATDPCGTTSGTGGCESFSGGSARSRPHQIGVQPHELSPREALQVPKDIVHGLTKLVNASPARAKTHPHQKQEIRHEMITCSRMMDPNPKQLTSAILFATTVK